jgi:phosphodiesterase/alkaline phosphatase D-like protein
MKKFFLIITALCAFSIMASAQFQVTVNLEGDCVQPDQDTYYVVKFYVYNNSTNTLVESQTVSVLTTYAGIPVVLAAQFSSFCTQDNNKVYKIYAEAAKVYFNPLIEICYGKKWTSPLYSCDDFVFNSPINIGVITLD